MTRTLIVAATLALAVPAAAQQPAPGWFPTGEWQCGYVRIITSTDGNAGVNFEVKGAWFDNNYTLRRGQLFYNGVPCLAVGQPFGSNPPARRRQSADNPSDKRCNDSLSIEDREKYCE